MVSGTWRGLRVEAGYRQSVKGAAFRGWEGLFGISENLNGQPSNVAFIPHLFFSGCAGPPLLHCSVSMCLLWQMTDFNRLFFGSYLFPFCVKETEKDSTLKHTEPNLQYQGPATKTCQDWFLQLSV